MNQFKPLSKTRRKNDRQYVWEYMRRNRIFKVEDLLPIIEMSLSNLQLFLAQLQRADYISVRIPLGKKSKPKKFITRTYIFKKNSGVLVPVWVPKLKRLFDRNTQEAQIRETTYTPKVSKKIEQRPVAPLNYAEGRVRQILAESRDISFNELQFRSGVPLKQFKAVLEEMVKVGAIRIEGSYIRGVEYVQR